MTQKQVKSGGWRTRRPGSTECGRRAVLSGYDTFTRVAAEESRAKLIAQIVNQADTYPPNEFSSYYYGSQYNRPNYSVTSHAYKPARKRATIASYPSIVGLRWDPNVQTSAEDLQTDVTNDHTFRCKCENCRMKYCPSKNPSANTLKPLKDNIMRFSDKETMTAKVKDAFCAACSSPTTPKTSDVSVTASCTRDTETGSHDFHTDFEPISILKKQNFYKCERCGYRKEKNVDIIHQPERDVEYVRDCVKPRSISSIFKRRRERPSELDAPRKTIYNEGINDLVANRFPLSPTIIPLPANLNSDNSRVSIPSMSIPNKFNIPYSHKSQSRYHTTCKRSTSRVRCDDNDELKHLVASPEIIRSNSGRVRHPKLPNIKLPRRVLTSERDIESYVDKTTRGHSGKGKK